MICTVFHTHPLSQASESCAHNWGGGGGGRGGKAVCNVRCVPSHTLRWVLRSTLTLTLTPHPLTDLRAV